jgi:AFG3 family protein
MGFAVAAVAFAFYLYTNQEGPADEITIQQMMRDYLMKGYVDKIQIVNKGYCRVHLRADAPGSDANRVLTIQLGTAEAFEAKIEALQNELGLSPLEHVAIQYVNETDMVSEILPHLPSLLILIPMILAARAMSSGMGGPGGPTGPGGRNIFSIGKAFPSGQKDVKSKTKFNDVAGLEQAKKEVVEFVDFLKNPAKYEKLGARVPKGGLLVGPPGTGKTLLAKAVAGEADCPFYSMSGSDFIEMFVGVGPSRVRDLFQQARASAPSIIFIDEIDAVGRKRGKGGFSGGGNDERENTLNQMLVEMDGFSTGTGVVVLAGTNRVDILDPALTRPGRFDRQIAIDKPDLGERESIFMVHLKPVKLEENLPLGDVAKRMAALTPGFAGADIANICNEAAIFAARRNSTGVSMNDFERATERVMGGLPKSNNLMSPKEKKTVALHESGHAVAGWFLENSDPLLKVSIVPRSNGALGFAQYLPDEISLYSREAILDKIAVSLGGRAAEELFVGRISTGASDDLDKVTKMAYAMVSVYGMNPQIGLLSYNNNSEQQFYKPYSEETGQVIDREARQIVEEQYERVKQLLNEKASLMTALADALSEKETLVYNELLEILGERPFGMKEEYKKFVTAGANPFTAEMPGASDGEGSSDTTADVDDGTSSSSSSTPRTDSATSATPEPEKAPASTP